MSLSDPLRAVGAVFRSRPADFFPLYFLGSAVPLVAQVVPFVAVVVAYLYVLSTGRLEVVETALAGVEEMPDPEGDPEAFGDWIVEFGDALEPLLTLPLSLLLGLAAIVYVGVFLIATAVVAGGQLATCHARLQNRRGTTAGIAGFRRYGVRFVLLYVLEIVLWIVVTTLVFLPVLFIAVLFALANPIVAVLVALLGVMVWVALIAVVRALFAFAPVAVVVDDAGVFSSLSNTAGFVRREPVSAAFYYAISVGSIMAVGVVSSALVFFEVVMPVTLATSLLLFPALDLLKTGLYQRYRDQFRPPATPDRSLRTQLRRGIRRGWSELVAFVRATPGTHVLVLGLAVASFYAGWWAAAPFAGTVPASISARIEGIIPPAFALELFANNWLVAINTAFAGVVFAVPALVSVVFNGLNIGVLARLEVEPLELLAFVVPHGIFEIPAILIASALGIRLGVLGWRTFRGRASTDVLADALERAFWVLVGLGILLAVAGFVEGFVSPYYWRPFL
ncbi:stage II sporulation protein M [Natrarchaeobaculum aegyptiacum]|uniref:Stage II sporulation protein M n=1 Tax=Natrarchaeobaculum aegyptiacum TaxID=745377 RepID=A0A2Z2HSI5_9EURY|nr:stage II sporulation protein M [Natrarchaeobaculum aegyptiacum]ARS89035.1 hypothetical protein B1756_04205 [Natrarchaeobaculum aegyptiacum]